MRGENLKISYVTRFNTVLYIFARPFFNYNQTAVIGRISLYKMYVDFCIFYFIAQLYDAYLCELNLLLSSLIIRLKHKLYRLRY